MVVFKASTGYVTSSNEVFIEPGDTLIKGSLEPSLDFRIGELGACSKAVTASCEKSQLGESDTQDISVPL